MNILKKLLLLLVLVSLTLVSCDLFVEEDEKIPDYIGTWALQTVTYSVGDSLYVEDHNEYDKPEFLLKLDSNKFSEYEYIVDNNSYSFGVYSYSTDGLTFTSGYSEFTFVRNGEKAYMTFISEDEDDQDNDGDITEDLTVVYLFLLDNETDLSNAVEVDVTAPGKVSNLTVTESDSFVTLTWTDPVDPDLSFIEISYDDNYTVASISPGVNKYVQYGLENGTTYKFTICTYDSNGNGSPGSSVSATPHL